MADEEEGAGDPEEPPSRVAKRGPWRRIGKYIGRDVWLANGRRSTELQHRVVAAQKVGRPLLSDEHAHHGNEVKTDNRPENLEVLTKAEHTRRHFGKGRTMITLTCLGCGGSFERDIRRRNSKYCCRGCSARAGGVASGLVRALATMAFLLLASCGGATSPTPTPPDCAPGSPDVELVYAPADVEFPTCVEMPAHQERGSTGRAWCCWKGTVQ